MLSSVPDNVLLNKKINLRHGLAIISKLLMKTPELMSILMLIHNACKKFPTDLVDMPENSLDGASFTYSSSTQVYILLLEFWLVALIIFKVRKMKRANFYVRLSGGPSPAHPFHRRGFELARILP